MRGATWSTGCPSFRASPRSSSPASGASRCASGSTARRWRRAASRSQDIEQAITRQNVELPSGRIEIEPRELTVKTDSRLPRPSSSRASSWRRAAATRSGWARSPRSRSAAEDERSEMRANRRTPIGLGIVRQSTANTLSVAEGAKKEMAVLQTSMPPDIELPGRLRRIGLHQAVDQRGVPRARPSASCSSSP